MLVTPARLRAVYVLLCQFPPFCRWNMPDAKLVRFKVLTTEDHAEYNLDSKGRPYIAVNVDTHTTLAQVIESVAHEMGHIHQDQIGKCPEDPKKHHNRDWRRIARVVCTALGFDVQKF